MGQAEGTSTGNKHRTSKERILSHYLCPLLTHSSAPLLHRHSKLRQKPCSAHTKLCLHATKHFLQTLPCFYLFIHTLITPPFLKTTPKPLLPAKTLNKQTNNPPKKPQHNKAKNKINIYQRKQKTAHLFMPGIQI